MNAAKRAIMLSVVSPVYRAATIVPELVRQLLSVLGGMQLPYEIILVNDGSPDDSWQAICTACAQHPQVVGINLSRNFGQHPAITAGISQARGQWVVVMDCDLQDRPEEIPKLYAHAVSGSWDVVLAQRVLRQDGFFKRLSSRLFYQTLSVLTGVKQDPSVANFGIYHHKVIQAVLSMPEPVRVFPLMTRWVGFKQTAIAVQHNTRYAGKSSYTFGKLMSLALDISLSYSNKPLHYTVRLGLILSAFSMLMAAYVFGKALNGGYGVSGYASIFLSIWFLTGIIVSILGVIGLYLGKVFDHVKQRPIYIIADIYQTPT